MSDQVVNPVDGEEPPVPAVVENPAETTAMPTDESRPWHGAESPLEALYQWMVAELERVRGSRK